MNHYFSENPQTPYKEFSVVYELCGRKFISKTASGIFSPKRLDLGTKVLLEYIIKRSNLDMTNSSILDFGCGWGAISQVLGTFFPEANIYYTDINLRAFDLAKKNLNSFKNCFPEKSFLDVEGVFLDTKMTNIKNKYKFIISNPPIKSGKKALQVFTISALKALENNGQIFYVIHKNLGADSFVKWVNSYLLKAYNIGAVKVSSAKGYRIIVLKKQL
ncbi:MAG: methyltransferase [Bifidobacteriaceae bacterium]|jgi:16S rRNA G1207 methylase RsmC|nr:methyltransferase [Bifidobacteriaceae bacterium]